MEMIFPQEKHRGAGLDEKEYLRRLLDCCKPGEWLLSPVVEYVEVFAMQSFHEVAAVIGHDHSDVHAVHANVNRLLRLLWIFLRAGKRTPAKQGGEEQSRL